MLVAISVLGDEYRPNGSDLTIEERAVVTPIMWVPAVMTVAPRNTISRIDLRLVSRGRILRASARPRRVSPALGRSPLQASNILELLNEIGVERNKWKKNTHLKRGHPVQHDREGQCGVMPHCATP